MPLEYTTNQNLVAHFMETLRFGIHAFQEGIKDLATSPFKPHVEKLQLMHLIMTQLVEVKAEIPEAETVPGNLVVGFNEQAEGVAVPESQVALIAQSVEAAGGEVEPAGVEGKARKVADGKLNLQEVEGLEIEDLNTYLADLFEDGSFDWSEAIACCTAHPEFAKFQKYLSASGVDEDDYTFGHEEGDPGEDIKDFCQWLASKRRGRWVSFHHFAC